jgi:general nucleoside transport system ATP-binding protein
VPEPAVSLRSITKRFGDVVAVRSASLDVPWGQIHALLGENGAGKTSLMNVLAGLYRPDAGEIHIDGRPAAIHSPEDAKRAGVGMVHQEQRLVTRFTAPENIALGHREPRWFVTRAYFERLAGRLSERYGLGIDAEQPVWMMPLGRRQRVELVKLLHHGARIIVLDEPTANLAPAEVEVFFAAVRQLAEAGRTVVFITHKLDEVVRYTDHVTIMRGGEVVASFPTSTTTRAQLNQLMVGSAAGGRVDGSAGRPGGGPGDAVLDIEALTIADVTQRVNLQAVSLRVRAGEVVGVAGVAGNGQTELAEAITGHVRRYDGRIRIRARDIRALGAREVAALGVAYVPEDRKDVGLIAGQSVAVNLALRDYRRPPFGRLGWVDHAAMRRAAVDLIERYGIRPPDPDAPAGRLSGGNQQRVIIAREFSGDPDLIVADNFTRGLDPRSTRQFTEQLFAHRDRGAAVLWITNDLGEALLCDRVAVMNRGRLVAVLPRAQADRERVGLLMSGDDVDAGAAPGPAAARPAPAERAGA